MLCTVVESSTPSEQLSAVLRFYRPLLKNKYDDVQRRGRDLEHLQTIAKRYKTSAKLLDDVALDPTEVIQGNTARRGSGFVTLSTVHSAKGLEWDNVFLIWMTDGWFPANRFQDEFDDFEEERRLLYVATTRAKRELHFVYPAVNVYAGPETDGTPTLSRFLEPIPPPVLPHAVVGRPADKKHKNLKTFCLYCLSLCFLWLILIERVRDGKLSRSSPKKMTLGTEWLIDASGCDAEALADIARLRAVFNRVINDLDLNVVGEIAWATFPSSRRRQRARTAFRVASRLPHVSRVSRRHFQSLLLSQPRGVAVGTDAPRDARRNRSPRPRL